MSSKLPHGCCIFGKYIWRNITIIYPSVKWFISNCFPWLNDVYVSRINQISLQFAFYKWTGPNFRGDFPIRKKISTSASKFWKTASTEEVIALAHKTTCHFPSSVPLPERTVMRDLLLPQSPWPLWLMNNIAARLLASIERKVVPSGGKHLLLGFFIHAIKNFRQAMF